MQNAVHRYSGIQDLVVLENIITEKLGENYRMYRSRWNSTTRKSVYEYPLHIDFELNDNCNQRCVMCPRNENTHPNTGYSINTKSYLSFDKFKLVIDESKLYNLMSINLGAFAEPFLNPDFKSMVQYARSANILDIRVITNGLLLEDYIDFILDEQITNIFISVDASSESTYGKIRGNGFNRVVENILSLVEKRQLKNLLLPLIRVSFVKFDINAHEVDSFIKYWSQYVDFIDIQPGENLSHPSTNKIYSDKRFDCVAPWQRVSILSSGDILPCCSFYGRYLPIGNINETSIKQAWDSELMSSIRRNLVSNTENVCDICQRSLLPQ